MRQLGGDRKNADNFQGTKDIFTVGRRERDEIISLANL